MFEFDERTKQLHVTRGNSGILEVTADNQDGNQYEFQVGDVVRFKVFKRKDCGCVELQKDIEVKEACLSVDVPVTSEETKIGDLINKPKDYWYEVELNPDTNCKTLVGFDKDGEKLFTLYPEGDEK